MDGVGQASSFGSYVRCVMQNHTVKRQMVKRRTSFCNGTVRDEEPVVVLYLLLLLLLLLVLYSNQHARIDEWTVKRRTGKHHCSVRTVRFVMQNHHRTVFIIIIIAVSICSVRTVRCVMQNRTVKRQMVKRRTLFCDGSVRDAEPSLSSYYYYFYYYCSQYEWMV